MTRQTYRQNGSQGAEDFDKVDVGRAAHGKAANREKTENNAPNLSTPFFENPRDHEAINDYVDDLFTRHYDRQVAIIRRRIPGRLKSKFDAEDVAQDTFIEAQRQLKEGVALPNCSEYGWLCRIARQKRIEQFRFHNNKKRDASKETVVDFNDENHDVAGKTPSPEETAIVKERKGIVHDALERLERQYAEIIKLHNYEGRTYKEIGEDLNISARQVKYRHENAMKQLQKAFLAMGIDESSV